MRAGETGRPCGAGRRGWWALTGRHLCSAFRKSFRNLLELRKRAVTQKKRRWLVSTAWVAPFCVLLALGPSISR